jgi:hypothetical protein
MNYGYIEPKQCTFIRNISQGDRKHTKIGLSGSVGDRIETIEISFSTDVIELDYIIEYDNEEQMNINELLNGMTVEDIYKLLEQKKVEEEEARLKESKNKYDEEIRKDEKRASLYLKQFKTKKEMEEAFKKMLMSNYEAERIKETESKIVKTENIPTKKIVKKCKANVCDTDENWAEEGFPSKWNKFRPCGKNCIAEYCRKHNDELERGKFGVLRDGAGTETPHDFPFHFIPNAKKNDKAWATAMWIKYPKMRPEPKEEEVGCKNKEGGGKPRMVKEIGVGCQARKFGLHYGEFVRLTWCGKTDNGNCLCNKHARELEKNGSLWDGIYGETGRPPRISDESWNTRINAPSPYGEENRKEFGI